MAEVQLRGWPHRPTVNNGQSGIKCAYAFLLITLVYALKIGYTHSLLSARSVFELYRSNIDNWKLMPQVTYVHTGADGGFQAKLICSFANSFLLVIFLYAQTEHYALAALNINANALRNLFIPLSTSPICMSCANGGCLRDLHINFEILSVYGHNASDA